MPDCSHGLGIDNWLIYIIVHAISPALELYYQPGIKAILSVRHLGLKLRIKLKK